MQVIRGTVTDGASGQPLSGAVVELEDGPAGTSTDDAGGFVLPRVPIGRHTVRVHHKGYQPAVLKEVLVGSAREVYLEVTLTERVISLDEVEVTPRVNKSGALNAMALLGGQLFSVEEAGRFAGGMDDPARLVSGYAGVATPNISNNGISIRGNAPSLLQWRLEGVEIPNPNHFADVDVLGGGFLSALSSHVLGNSDFFVGAFPAEYSNAVSGVFDMQLRPGSSRSYQHTFQLGMLGIDLASEGPISRKAGSSYLVNYRYSTTGLLEKLRPEEDMGGTLGYQDLNVKLNFPTAKGGAFTVWGLGFVDEVKPVPDDPEAREYAEEGILSAAKQKSGAAGISYRHLFADRRTSLKTTLAATHLGNRIDESFYDPDDRKSPRTDLTARTTNVILTAILNHKFGTRHTNRTGFTWTHMHYDMDFDFTPVFGGPLENYARSSEGTDLVSAFTSSLVALRPDLALTAGLNVQHLRLNGRTTVEPRAGLRWEVTPRSSLAMGYGLHSRMEKPDVYFVKGGNGTLPNKDLAFTKSHHIMFSYVYRIAEDMSLKIDPYFQSLFDVPITENGGYSILNRKEFYITELLVSKGRGRNYGVDVTFSKYLTGGMYYMATASLFDSRYRAGDGRWYNTRYNRKFIVNALIGKEWMFNRDMLGINLKGSLLGGQRYTPVDMPATLQHPDREVQYDGTQMYRKQFPARFIGDFTVSYRLNRRRVAHEFAVKSVNATGQKEYINHRYNLKTGRIEPYFTATSLFNISYQLAF